MSQPPPPPQRASLAQPQPPIAPGFQPTTPCPTVLLCHTLPNGDAHFDWLLASEPHGEQPLITFRMGQRVDELSIVDVCESLVAESIGHHRPAYLTYEGPVSGDRGHVERVRSGTIEQWTIDHIAAWRLVIRWDAGDGRSRVRRHLQLNAADSDMMHWQVSNAKPA